MAGHSHWANIKHKKAANDAKKAKVITQMTRLIKGAIQVGGTDPDANPRLRLAIQKAKAQNVTNDTIDRLIAKASGEGSDKPVEDLVYEGYAAAGVAVVVETMTDNRNRTGPEMRKLFERGGGSMGAPGCVAWQFKDRALFVVTGSDEDSLLELLLEADAEPEDLVTGEDDSIQITAEPSQYEAIDQALAGAAVEVVSKDLTKISDNAAEVTDIADGQKVQKLLDLLEEHDDVTGVHTNFSPTAAVAAEL